MSQRTNSSDESSGRSSNLTFESLATADASELLELLEQREAEEFGTRIDPNEAEESRMIRQIALKQIFAFLVDKSDARVANLRLSKRGVHMKLNVTMEPKTEDHERLVIARDPKLCDLLNLYQPLPNSETPVRSPSPSTARKGSVTSTSMASNASNTQTARLIPDNFAQNICDRLVALVVKQETPKEK